MNEPYFTNGTCKPPARLEASALCVTRVSVQGVITVAAAPWTRVRGDFRDPPSHGALLAAHQLVDSVVAVPLHVLVRVLEFAGGGRRSHVEIRSVGHAAPR
jgi:hypothetical protein